VAKTNPRKLRGPWASGYALDVHSTGSEFLGYDEFGHEQYDTKRTEMGELLYRVKYKGDDAALDELVGAMVEFVKASSIKADILVPVPPTRARTVQPLFKICDHLAAALKIPVTRTAATKSAGAELKNLHSFEERTKALENMITIEKKSVSGKTVLLVDDLVRSGATIAAVATELKKAGAIAVHVLTATETRRK
jgi:competence protein ComFC